MTILIDEMLLNYCHFKYGHFIAIENRNLEVVNGEALNLLRQSGCGKTSIMCCAGLEEPTSGRIVIDDVVVLDSSRGINLPRNQRNVGLVFQSYGLRHVRPDQRDRCRLGRQGTPASDAAGAWPELVQPPTKPRLAGLRCCRPAWTRTCPRRPHWRARSRSGGLRAKGSRGSATATPGPRVTTASSRRSNASPVVSVTRGTYERRIMLHSATHRPA